MSIASVSASNEFARNMIAILKAGGHLKGTVKSHSSYGSTDITWVAVEFPVVGDRQVPIKCDQNLQLGQEVVVECVPHPFKAGRYVFKLAGVSSSAQID